MFCYKLKLHYAYYSRLKKLPCLIWVFISFQNRGAFSAAPCLIVTNVTENKTQMWHDSKEMESVQDEKTVDTMGAKKY
jgi:hypothetical protein